MQRYVCRGEKAYVKQGGRVVRSTLALLPVQVTSVRKKLLLMRSSRLVFFPKARGRLFEEAVLVLLLTWQLVTIFGLNFIKFDAIEPQFLVYYWRFLHYVSAVAACCCVLQSVYYSIAGDPKSFLF